MRWIKTGNCNFRGIKADCGIDILVCDEIAGQREALKGLLAGSIPCRGFCSVGLMGVLTFLLMSAAVRVLEICF
jgi:hypothetical protein